MTTYTSEPGTRLGGRYRLEDRIAAGSGWAAWKAIDETLARAVTVFTFAQGFPRIGEVVTAARAASRLTDPRLAQVFDVDDAWDRAYIVMEWAAGDTLGDLLAEGPLEPYRAARMMSEAAAALSSAHAAGVAHMCLSPGSVRWSQTGEVKVVGLGIDAALSGVSADDPVLTDTRGLGQLLYAALTGHWPGPDYPTLPPAPVADGQPCSPRQVVAGVPLTLSDLACRAMQLRTRDDGPAVTAPEQLASALVAVLPPVLPPALPPRPKTASGNEPRGHGDAAQTRWSAAAGEGGWAPETGSVRPEEEAGWTGEAGRADSSWWSADPPRSGRLSTRRSGPSRGQRGVRGQRGRPGSGLRSRLSLISIGAAGLLALAAIAAFTLWPRHGGGPAGQHGSRSASPSASATVLRPIGATGFDPLTSSDTGNENSQYAQFAIDASMKTAWVSQWYRSAHFGGLKPGSGLIINMGKQVKFGSVTVTFGSIPGASIKLLVGNSSDRSQANLASMKTVAARDNVTGTVTFRLTSATSGQYLVIWFTALPQAPHSHTQWMAKIFNVTISGVGWPARWHAGQDRLPPGNARTRSRLNYFRSWSVRITCAEIGATACGSWGDGGRRRRDRAGDATKSDEPGGNWTRSSLPEPRRAPEDRPASRSAAPDDEPAGGAPAPASGPSASSAPRTEFSQAASSDAELLKKHVAGDRDAFGELFLRHRDRLWAVAVRTLSDPEEAADALQDAMISAFRRADSFRGDSAVTTWLHRIVVNACLDRMRRRAARPALSGGDERLLDSAAIGGAVADPSSDSDLSLDVMAALRRLPHDQQVALVLVDMLGYPVADAAEVLSVSQGTVKSRCARGRARLLPRLAYLRHPDKTGQSGAIAEPGFSEQADQSRRAMRNRSATGAVLPAQEGGDEAQ